MTGVQTCALPICEILLLRFATDLEELAKVEMMPKLDGKKMNMILAPKNTKK